MTQRVVVVGGTGHIGRPLCRELLRAGFNGVSFLNYGHGFSSMIMAGLWALALACYVTGMYLSARRLVRGSV